MRIIAGRWRGRRLPVEDVDALRPSPDRVRETLFNWLMPALPDSRVLDLFAGTGVLGMEAVSRGAREAVLVERDAGLVATLERQCRALDPDRLSVVRSDAFVYLRSPGEAFDVVFLDPPYHRDLLAPSITALSQGGWLVDGCLIYLEAERSLTPPLAPHWTLLRSKAAGDVGYHLAQYSAPGHARFG